MKEEDQTFLQEENARLHAKVADLEDKLALERLRAGSTGAADTLRREIPRKLETEARTMSRALVFALLEQVHATLDTVKAVADEAFHRDEYHMARLTASDCPERSGARLALDRVAEIPHDLTALTSTGLNGLFAMPRRVLEKFLQFYRDPQPRSGPATAPAVKPAPV